MKKMNPQKEIQEKEEVFGRFYIKNSDSYFPSQKYFNMRKEINRVEQKLKKNSIFKN